MPANRFTPFPNLLLDVVMPHLSDTEFRVLVIITRQTLGWRQEQKWLSHALLKYSTGRHSAAISRAIDGLVKRGLVVVRDEDARRLHRAAERRRSRSKLLYSLHPLLLESETYRSRIGFGFRTLEVRKAKTTKERRRKKNTEAVNE